MGVALGWQRMHNSNPYILGQAWNDRVTRSGNTVSYSLNLSMKVGVASGYWDYLWYVDMQVGSHTSNNRKVKNSTAWHQVIGGREFYQSTFNGNFTGTTTVSGKASSITLRAQFHDSHGNRGPNVYWNVPIPTATSMDDIKKEVSGVGSDIASISAKVTKTGNYSTITSWELEYGVKNYSENVKTISGNNLSVHWLLENLLADTNYKYRITVVNSSGYSKQATGVFRTEEEVIGYKVTKGELIEPGVYEDGEASGEFVQIDNTYENEGQITSVEMLGNAEQTTYSGKNLLNINATPSTLNATSSVSGQTITVTTNSNATTGRVLLPLTYEANRQITISFDAKMIQNDAGSGLISTVNLRTPDGSDTVGSVTISNTVGQTNHYRATVTPDNNTRWLWLYAKATSVAGVVKVEYSNIQIEYSSSETDYEKFVGGTASPNPDYPQPISTVTGEQTVRVTGKNLVEDTISGSSIDGNGIIRSNSDFDTQVAFVIEGKTYTLSYTGGTVVGGYFATKPTINSVSIDGTRIVNNNKTFVAQYTGYFTFRTNTGESNAQCELGSTATAYEPYQGQSYEVNLGKNLLDNKATTRTYLGVTLTKNNDGSITLNGTSTGNAQFYLDVDRVGYQGRNSHLGAGTYTINGRDSGGVKFEINYKPTNGGVLYSWGTFTAAEPFDYGIYVTVTNGTTVNNLRIYPQLERGSQATSFAPYFTPIELCKIGNYQDRIYENEGKWYVEKQIKKYVFDGSENWTLYPSKLHTFRTGLGEDRALDGICDHFVKGLASAFDVTPCFYASNTGVAIFSYPDMADVSAWTTWLSTHPTTVYYVLATPTTTEITDVELIAQLEALGVATLYVGMNNVLVATNNASPTLKIDYKLTVKEPVYDDRSDELVGWIIYPDGRKKKIKEIRRVYPT